MSKIKFCITGGSGFIGTAAMSFGISEYETINFDIRPPKILEHHHHWKFVDIRDDKSFTEALIEFQPTHILHLAAQTGMDIHDMSFFDANTMGVENLIQATRKITSLRRVLFTSSLLVCPNGRVPATDTEYDPPNLYGESKVIGEKLVRESRMKCSWVIVRPTSIWGPWFEHSYRTFFQILDRGLFVQPGFQKIVKPFSFVGNTVHMMHRLLFYPNEQVDGQTYYLADYPEYSIQEWADQIRQRLGRNGKNPVFPVYVLMGLARIGDLLKIMGWQDPPLTTFRLKNILTGAKYPIEKTQKLVGQLPYSMTEGVSQTLEWMRIEKLVKMNSIPYK